MTFGEVLKKYNLYSVWPDLPFKPPGSFKFQPGAALMDRSYSEANIRGLVITVVGLAASRPKIYKSSFNRDNEDYIIYREISNIFVDASADINDWPMRKIDPLIAHGIAESLFANNLFEYKDTLTPTNEGLNFINDLVECYGKDDVICIEAKLYLSYKSGNLILGLGAAQGACANFFTSFYQSFFSDIEELAKKYKLRDEEEYEKYIEAEMAKVTNSIKRRIKEYNELQKSEPEGELLEVDEDDELELLECVEEVLE